MEIGFSTKYNNINIYENYPVLQVTLGSPDSASYEKNIDYEKYKNKKNKIFIHTKFTYNISKKNINYSIKEEITFLKNINQKNTGIIIHLSKHYKNNNEEGLKDIVEKLNELCEKYLKNTSFFIILETSYNLNHLGVSIDDFYYIYNNINDLSKLHIGFCLDTSHLYLSGYPINNINFLIEYISLFEQKLGLDKIKLIHLNDINSIPFGSHTPHLSILDSNGKIFYNNYICLDFIISLSKKKNIPIILERNFSLNIKDDINKINKEIKFIENYQNTTFVYFNKIIKNIIFLNFVNLLIDFNEINLNSQNIKILKKLKHNLIESYNENNKEFYSSKIKSLDNKNILEMIENPEYKIYYEDFKNILLSYNYKIFLKYLEEPKYKTIKNLLTLKFIGIESALKLYNSYNITSLDDLLNLSLKEKKKILNITQYKSLQLYKFLKNNINFNIAIEIETTIKNNLPKNFDFNIYGSYYRNKEEKNLFKTFKDLDGLLVINNDNEINLFLNELYKFFLLKGVIVDGNKKKYIVLKYSKNNKNYYFILDLYICYPDEKIFMMVFLKNPYYKNILLRKIAKSKNYILSNTSLYDIIKEKNIILNNEKELYNLLNVNF